MTQVAHVTMPLRTTQHTLTNLTDTSMHTMRVTHKQKSMWHTDAHTHTWPTQTHSNLTHTHKRDTRTHTSEPQGTKCPILPSCPCKRGTRLKYKYKGNYLHGFLVYWNKWQLIPCSDVQSLQRFGFMWEERCIMRGSWADWHGAAQGWKSEHYTSPTPSGQ